MTVVRVYFFSRFLSDRFPNPFLHRIGVFWKDRYRRDEVGLWLSFLCGGGVPKPPRFVPYLDGRWWTVDCVGSPTRLRFGPSTDVPGRHSIQKWKWVVVTLCRRHSVTFRPVNRVYSHSGTPSTRRRGLVYSF